MNIICFDPLPIVNIGRVFVKLNKNHFAASLKMSKLFNKKKCETYFLIKT